MNRAIFIDKDGEVNSDLPDAVNPNLITLLPDIREGLSVLQSWGYKIIIVSNQPYIAKGFFQEADVLKFHIGLQQIFNVFGLRLDGFYYCPHHPDGKIPKYAISCKCRKPLPGLLFQAAQELNIDLNQSWMIGDVLREMEAGKRAGCKTLLVDNGNEKEWIINPQRVPDYITYDFSYAITTLSLQDIHYASLN